MKNVYYSLFWKYRRWTIRLTYNDSVLFLEVGITDTNSRDKVPTFFRLCVYIMDQTSSRIFSIDCLDDKLHLYCDTLIDEMIEFEWHMVSPRWEEPNDSKLDERKIRLDLDYNPMSVLLGKWTEESKSYQLLVLHIKR